MASIRHQFMLTLVARKMRTLGFEPVAYDGDSYHLGLNKLRTPPTILRHRPDIVGVDSASSFCIGEVKTENDISSRRTANQLVDFSKDAELIICTNKKGEPKLASRLSRLGLLFKKNIHLLIVPDELIPYDEECM